MDYIFLERIRGVELEAITKFLPKKGRILELGAGAGWQAKKLMDKGFDVCAIDVDQQTLQNYNYQSQRVFEVTVYDGYTIPFPNDFFDCVYSSNVLEHIPHIEAFQLEIKRVLKSKGLSIHTMPTPSWRFWSILSYYLLRTRNLLFRSKEALGEQITQKSSLNKNVPLLKRLIIRRHGERGNVMTEFYLFSSLAWKKLFQKSGWKILNVEKGEIFYSGEHLFGSLLSMRVRGMLCRILGSPINIFVLENEKK